MDRRTHARIGGTLATIFVLGLGAVTAVAEPPEGAGNAGGNGNGKPDPAATAPADPNAVPGQDGVLPGNSGNTPAADRPEHPEHPEQSQKPDTPPGQAGGEPGSGGEAGDAALPPAEPPAVGKRVNAGKVAGTVKVRLPGGKADVPLGDVAGLPVGSVIDARQGTVELTSAADASGTPQTARFRGGRFSVVQRAGEKPVTELALRGGSFASCPKPRAKSSGVVARASAKRSKKVRSLWGSGKGAFRTKGRNSAATVRGTVWEVTDRCDGTLTKVHEGVVAVRDFARKRTVSVRAGKSYLARK